MTEKLGTEFYTKTRIFDDVQIFLFKLQNSIINEIKRLTIIVSGRCFLAFNERKYFPPVFIKINETTYSLKDINNYFHYFPLFELNLDENIYGLKLDSSLQLINSSIYDEYIDIGIKELYDLNVKFNNKVEGNQEDLNQLIEKLNQFSINYSQQDENSIIIEDFKIIFTIGSTFGLESKLIKNYIIARPKIKNTYTVKTRSNDSKSDSYLSLGFIINYFGSINRHPEFDLVLYNNLSGEIYRNYK